MAGGIWQQGLGVPGAYYVSVLHRRLRGGGWCGGVWTCQNGRQGPELAAAGRDRCVELVLGGRSVQAEGFRDGTHAMAHLSVLFFVRRLPVASLSPR